MAEKKSLTVKQTMFVKEYINNSGNGREAAKAVYDVANDNSASQLASETLSKPNVKSAIEEALKKHGITIEKATKPIADGLVAEKVSIVGNGDQSFAEVTPDHSIRLKASGMALKLMGAEQKEATGNTFIFNKGDVVSKKYVKD